uniref:Tick transposon n=1 Tax=Heterorhabditis bacteriophora TaxID=37862 RepID=A0A1I7XCZ3_HETBA
MNCKVWKSAANLINGLILLTRLFTSLHEIDIPCIKELHNKFSTASHRLDSRSTIYNLILKNYLIHRPQFVVYESNRAHAKVNNSPERLSTIIYKCCLMVIFSLKLLMSYADLETRHHWILPLFCIRETS